jgi:hypothetical protein
MTKRNLKAVSVFLDDKRYMMGDHPTSVSLIRLNLISHLSWMRLHLATYACFVTVLRLTETYEISSNRIAETFWTI